MLDERLMTVLMNIQSTFSHMENIHSYSLSITFKGETNKALQDQIHLEGFGGGHELLQHKTTDENR
jgi:hypothetical protein